MTETATPKFDAASDAYSPHVLQLGCFRVTALHDGHFDLPKSFISVEPGDTGEDAPNFRLDINAFLVQSENHNILIDTGAGAKTGSSANKLIPSLQVAGLTPSDIDFVLCTHIHPDHTNGLVDIDGKPLFDNANIVVHRAELDYWLSDEGYSKSEPSLRYIHDWAREAFGPYEARMQSFTKGQIVTGIEAIPLFGHTPGHSGFHIDGGGVNQLIIWGDVVHDIVAQSRNPHAAAQADLDQDEARNTRIALFDRVAADDMLCAGMHVRFPGFGRLRRNIVGYEYTPQR